MQATRELSSLVPLAVAVVTGVEIIAVNEILTPPPPNEEDNRK